MMNKEAKEIADKLFEAGADVLYDTLDPVAGNTEKSRMAYKHQKDIAVNRATKLIQDFANSEIRKAFEEFKKEFTDADWIGAKTTVRFRVVDIETFLKDYMERSKE